MTSSHRPLATTFAFAASIGLVVAATAATACSSEISCAELGSDWTTCPSPNESICVKKGREGACQQLSGGGSSSSSSSSSSTSSGSTSQCSSSFETLCSGKCVVLSSDDLNCGQCGRVCSASQVCFSGECQ